MPGVSYLYSLQQQRSIANSATAARRILERQLKNQFGENLVDDSELIRQALNMLIVTYSCGYTPEEAAIKLAEAVR